MFNFIAGTILFLLPFLLLGLFVDKRRGFVYIIFSILFFHVALAFFTQLFGIFYYQVIFWATLLADVLALAILFKFRNKFSFKFSNIDWVAVLVVFVAVLTLYQVHYNYTGKASLVMDKPALYHEVKNMQYPYPYFSDEWYAVSLIEGAIKFHSLPFHNLLDNGFFSNLEMFSHSFLAELTLLLDFDPLTQYTVLSIIINTLIVILVYLFLRLADIPKKISAIFALFVLYITCGANLPGIQHLIPVTLGILFSLIGFCFIQMRKTKMVLLSFFTVSLFYPLLSPFYILSVLIYLFSTVKKLKENKFKIIGYSALAIFLAVPLVLILLLISPAAWLVNLVFSKLYYFSFTGFFIPQYNIFYIVPWCVLVLALAGFQVAFKKTPWLFWPLIIGILYWISYFFTTYRFIIEFERAIYFTSIIICITAAFGFQKLKDYFISNFNKKANIILKLVESAAIIAFVLFIPFYTSGENWKELVSINQQTKDMVYPRGLANNYLTPDDLNIFKDIKGKKFLSIPWKGTVIGVATENYPAATKGGTITLGPLDLTDNFIQGDCAKKTDMVKNLKLDYVYLLPFDCPGFEKIDQSSEGFVLYKVL
jgi:hypothetical protein